MPQEVTREELASIDGSTLRAPASAVGLQRPGAGGDATNPIAGLVARPVTLPAINLNNTNPATWKYYVTNRPDRVVAARFPVALSATEFNPEKLVRILL